MQFCGGELLAVQQKDVLVSYLKAAEGIVFAPKLFLRAEFDGGDGVRDVLCRWCLFVCGAEKEDRTIFVCGTNGAFGREVPVGLEWWTLNLDLWSTKWIEDTSCE